MKTLFEESGGTYQRVGDYYLPDLDLPQCNFHCGIDKSKYQNPNGEDQKALCFFMLKINYGLIRYLVITASEMLQQALNNAGIIRMSGIIPETLNMTRRYFMLNRNIKITF